MIDKQNGKNYIFSYANAKRTDKSLIVTGEIKAYRHFSPTHVDMTILDQKGGKLYSGSIDPKRTSFTRHTSSILGHSMKKNYSFRYELPLTTVNPPDKSVIKISIHSKNEKNTEPPFDCEKS